MTPALLTIAEACVYLGTSRDKLERLRRSDMQLAAAFVLMGRMVRVHRARLDQWMEALPPGWDSRGGRRRVA
jgi:excisionase family DNA binding protein